MKKSRTIRWAALAATTAFAAATLAGCAGGGGGTGGGAVDPESLEGQTITYWASNQGSSVSHDEEVLGASIERFTEETGVEVELEVIPWSDLLNRILGAVSSGEGPDVLNIGNTWAVSMEATGAFMEWDDAAMEKVGGADRFTEAALATGGSEGATPTSLPLYSLAYAMYYNKAMFAEAGIEAPPATWDEFLEAGEKLTKDTDGDGEIDQWGHALAGQRTSNNAHATFILGKQHGGDLYDADGNPDFTNDAIVAAVNDWVQLMGENGIVSPSNAELDDGSLMAQEVANGRAAMMFDQAAGSTLESLDFSDWGVAPIPMQSADATGEAATQSHVAGINIAVFENSDSKDAAIAFVNHLLSADEQEVLGAEFGALPPVTDALDAEAFNTPEMEVLKGVLADHAQPMPLFASESQAEELIGAAVAELFATIAQGGEVTEDDVRAALEDAQAQMPAA
ncbi:ABC transporter substrate-binding protein [Microbacterium paludicola]|uniref:Sugar ABC transporter substrate-binding protein n=1 Tax=Microbacterium paludicola TaxID=300019 RepID=A0A4Y9FN65_9MICO|nr:sugar ABC transporter substrate-binding protein [Microbacterium paludicola]MBF0817579.1 sugar ABC transporter substrate-binding protein [Microbacterium paludicola]TFU30657.1 sugar ABC transporter substrate-binding protein [Microbacterium paludicola]